MSKGKRSHHKNDGKLDESDEQSSSEESTSSVDNSSVAHKKRHHKKSKKVRKHKSKRKDSTSESDSDSSSSDSSSDEEIVKRKKQKKHKKSKRRHRHDTNESVAGAIDSGGEHIDDAQVKIIKESQKIHHVSSGDEDQQRYRKNKRVDEMKKLRGPAFEDKEIKSKWDSPTDDYERKRYKDGRDREQRTSNHRSSLVQNEGHRSTSQERYRTNSRNDNSARRDKERERNPKEVIRRRDEDDSKRIGHRQSQQPPLLPTQQQQPQHDDSNSRYKRNISRSRSASNDIKRTRPLEYGRDRDVHHDNREQPRNRERQRHNDDRPNRGFERRRSNSPQQRNDFNRNRGNYNDNRRDNNRRTNFNDNRRDGANNNFNRRDNYRREFNDGANNNNNNQNNRRPYERPLSNDGGAPNDRERSWRDRDAHPHRAAGGDRREWHDRERTNRSPNRSNPFRRNDDAPPVAGSGGGFNRRLNNNRQDFRHGESRPDRNDQRSNSRNRGRSRSKSSTKREKYSKKDSDNENYEWGRKTDKVDDADADEANEIEKEKPNFGLSGKLTEDTNKVNGIVIKYSEPAEARRPKRRWRLYPFKGDKSLQTMHIHRQSCYLIGRDKKICELAVDHPSCSKQHAALQYRLVPYEKEDGTKGKHVRPYIIDLESANGTFVNNKKIDAKKYVELIEKDVLKFGFSTREYVLLHENSNNDDDDEIVLEEEPVKSEPKDE